MRIAVVGGTGAVGRHAVAAVHALGHEPVVLARSTGVDLTTGAGLVEALADAEAVIDTSNVITNSASVNGQVVVPAGGQIEVPTPRG